jgi:hypothetical protein
VKDSVTPPLSGGNVLHFGKQNNNFSSVLNRKVTVIISFNELPLLWQVQWSGKECCIGIFLLSKLYQPLVRHSVHDNGQWSKNCCSQMMP